MTLIDVKIGQKFMYRRRFYVLNCVENNIFHCRDILSGQARGFHNPNMKVWSVYTLYLTDGGPADGDRSIMVTVKSFEDVPNKVELPNEQHVYAFSYLDEEQKVVTYSYRGGSK